MKKQYSVVVRAIVEFDEELAEKELGEVIAFGKLMSDTYTDDEIMVASDDDFRVVDYVEVDIQELEE